MLFLSHIHTTYPMGKKCKKEANEDFCSTATLLVFYVENKFKMRSYSIFELNILAITHWLRLYNLWMFPFLLSSWWSPNYSTCLFLGSVGWLFFNFCLIYWHCIVNNSWISIICFLWTILIKVITPDVKMK